MDQSPIGYSGTSMALFILTKRLWVDFGSIWPLVHNDQKAEVELFGSSLMEFWMVWNIKLKAAVSILKRKAVVWILK